MVDRNPPGALRLAGRHQSDRTLSGSCEFGERVLAVKKSLAVSLVILSARGEGVRGGLNEERAAETEIVEGAVHRLRHCRAGSELDLQPENPFVDLQPHINLRSAAGETYRSEPCQQFKDSGSVRR